MSASVATGLPGLRLELGSWDELRAAAEPVRRAVFIKEQGCSEESEWDELDDPSLHCVAFLDAEPIGTGRLLPENRIGRMAVTVPYRRHGVASVILEELVAVAAQRGAREVVLHAQVAVLDFYRRHGFVEEGAEFSEEGIAHLLMRRSLDQGEG